MNLDIKIFVFCKEKAFYTIRSNEVINTVKISRANMCAINKCTHAREKAVDNFLILAIFILINASYSRLSATEED